MDQYQLNLAHTVLVRRNKSYTQALKNMNENITYFNALFNNAVKILHMTEPTENICIFTRFFCKKILNL